MLLSSIKNSKKNLDAYCLVTSFGFLSLKNYVEKLYKKITGVFCWRLEGQ
jgi:hypothetical protein